MNKLTKSLHIFITLVMVVAGVVGWFIINHVFPKMTFSGYAIIPLFFYFMGIIFIWRFKQARFHDSTHIVNLYMLLRMIKVFTSFAILIVYWVIHTTYIRNFAITFVIFYLLSIMMETHIYLKMEKFMKFESEQNRNTEEREHIE